MKILRGALPANGRIWILTVLAAVLLTGCRGKEGAGKEREDVKDKWRYSVQEASGFPEKEYALAAVTKEMVYGCYQEDDTYTIALFSRKSGKIEKQVSLPEKVSYIQDLRVDRGGNLYVISADQPGGLGMRWKIDRKGNLREV